ncbi:DUF6416 domain-containing protein [Streptomyces sp. NBC_01190]|uniref:DUF6416 domain-containing protein n=1 Tax=Streptomyces sp. NBC_01190 TaxID=2903767 RepID=UPI00386CB182|nr:DUF6416 domain-containing protein [Streptomyces sp. NBC_01190]
MEDRDRQFVAVHVPQEYVMKVYAFIAELDGSADLGAESPLPGGTKGADPDANRPYAEWEVADLRSLAATKLPSISRVAAVLDVLAGHPGTRFSTTVLVDRLGIEREQLRGSLAALTRHIHAHYGRGNWPMTFTWGGEVDGKQSAEAFYSVDETSAARWLEARTAR